MIGVCIIAAGAAAGMISLPVDSFTLAWVHSIEKVRWEEDYRIDGARLAAVAARVKGSAAGMEPPAGATLKDGWWHYQPANRQHDELRLTRSAFTSDYEICIHGACRSLTDIAPQTEGVTRVFSCAGAPQR